MTSRGPRRTRRGAGDATRPAASTTAAPVIRITRSFEDTWPGSSALATSCVLNLANLVGRIEDYGLAIIRARGVTSLGAFNVLTILFGEAPLLPSMIAERMIVTRGTVTSLLDTLEGHGLVRRSPHPGDARRRLVDITPRGRALVRELLPLLHRAERRWMSSLDQRNQRELLRMVALIQAGAPDRPARPS